MTHIEKVINGKTIRFELKINGVGEVCLVATHINGELSYAGNLLSINKDGKFERIRDVDPDFGFKLNSYGQIKQVKGE